MIYSPVCLKPVVKDVPNVEKRKQPAAAGLHPNNVVLINRTN